MFVAECTHRGHAAEVSEGSCGMSVHRVPSILPLLGRHGSDSLCRDEREKKMAATYNVLALKR